MKHEETLGQPLPRGTTGASATNRLDHGGCPIDLQELAQAAGMVSYLNHGAASCVHSEGCHGVTQEHLERFTELVRAAELERWKMPRRKRDALQMRHDYLSSIPHHRRNQYMEAEISALDWVLHRVRA